MAGQAYRRADAGRPMIELIRTNDQVLISWLRALLGDAGIPVLVFDGHASLVEGSVGALPCRVMVEDADAEPARRLLAAVEAGDGAA